VFYKLMIEDLGLHSGVDVDTIWMDSSIKILMNRSGLLWRMEIVF
jgi:hypothetical protein